MHGIKFKHYKGYTIKNISLHFKSVAFCAEQPFLRVSRVNVQNAMHSQARHSSNVAMQMCKHMYINS